MQWPQELLKQDAIKNQVMYIDFVKTFENIINNDTTKIANFFLDEDHYTVEGHKVVAQELSKVLLKISMAYNQKN